MKAKSWILAWGLLVLSTFSVLGFWVYKIDPYFHYHKPLIKDYFYQLNNQRSQNNGISRNFEYDALITGTSMTENFRTTEADKLFGRNFIKVSYSGGSYKEINDNIIVALENNDNVKTIIRSLDMNYFFDTSDRMRDNLGKYPTYLYDDNLFNDVEYLLNRDVIKRIFKMMNAKKKGFKPGITSFDEYSRWQDRFKFGIKTVSPKGLKDKDTTQVHLTADDKEIIQKNIELNIIKVAKEHPEVDFYCFYPPYSVVQWNKWKTQGTLYKVLEAEAYITELIVPHKNIFLFSFNNRTDITTDLNNYKDGTHYATWISSLILKWMYEGKYRLTEKNYKVILKKEYNFYTQFDYTSVNGQKDYEADFYAAALLNEELTGAKPIDVFNDKSVNGVINGAEFISSKGRNTVLNCHGRLARDYTKESIIEYIRDKEYIGIKFNVDLDKGYNYLCFNGQKITNHGGLIAYVYNKKGKLVKKLEVNYKKLNSAVHQYVMDLSAISGKVTIVLNGGYTDSTGSKRSNYQFSNVVIY